MPVQDQPFDVALPRAFFFLTVSRGARTKTVAVRAALLYAFGAAGGAAALAGIGAILCLLFHDTLVASLMKRQSEMQYAYEDRIDSLRGELQQQSSRQLRDQSAVDVKLRDLFSRASELQIRSDLLAGLGGPVAAPQPPGAHPPRSAATPSSALDALKAVSPPGALPPVAASAYAPATGSSSLPVQPKPRPETGPEDGEHARPGKFDGRVSLLDTTTLPVPSRISALSASFDDIDRSQVGALRQIETAARVEATRLAAVLDEVGLSPDRFRGSMAATTANEGGPFVPLPDDGTGAFRLEIAATQGVVASTLRLRSAVGRLPLQSPLAGQPEITSPFGARLDPFLGRPALHTGVDLRGDYGVLARATSAGRVVSAGAMGGYGNMVEVDHGAGLTTRYAHLTAVLVKPGQVVGKGDVVGEVGATGRATGPHLHYEVRIDGAPVDPVRFLNAGFRVAQLAEH